MLCDDLEAWDEAGWVGGLRGRDFIYIYIKLIHIAVQK